jgi:hypothetical protein
MKSPERVGRFVRVEPGLAAWRFGGPDCNGGQQLPQPAKWYALIGVPQAAETKRPIDVTPIAAPLPPSLRLGRPPFAVVGGFPTIRRQVGSDLERKFCKTLVNGAA